jgi:hypothetical protein
MRQGINSLPDCGMTLGSRSRFNLKTDGNEPSTLHIYIDLRYCTNVNYLFRNGQDARSTKKFTLCGTGILPVLENGARSQILCTFPQSILHRILHQVCG